MTTPDKMTDEELRIEIAEWDMATNGACPRCDGAGVIGMMPCRTCNCTGRLMADKEMARQRAVAFVKTIREIGK